MTLAPSKRGLRRINELPLEKRALAMKLRDELNNLCDQYSLPKIDLVFQIGDKTRRCGQFTYKFDGSNCWIQITVNHFAYGEAEVLKTLRHEFAHYYCFKKYGPSVGHGPEWQAISRMVGGGSRLFRPSEVGKAASDTAPVNKNNWVYTCPGCGQSHERSRRYTWEQTARRACSTCRTPLREFKLKRI